MGNLDNEKILFPRVFLGDWPMPKEWIDRIVSLRQIPDGYTEALLLANELKTDYEAHRIVTPSVHNSADSTNAITADNATSEATLILLANDLKAMMNAHFADITAHNSADSAITLADATTLKTAVLLINACRTAYEAHRVNVTVHDGADTVNVIAALPAYSWTQRYSGDEGATVTNDRDVSETRNQQVGTTKKYIKEQKRTFKVPITDTEFRDWLKLAQADPNAASDATAGTLRRNAGTVLTGFTMLIYDMQTDPGNESDIPSFTGDADAQVMYNCVLDGGQSKVYNGEQLVFQLEGEALVGYLTGSGSGKGSKGDFGTFTAVSYS